MFDKYNEFLLLISGAQVIKYTKGPPPITSLIDATSYY